MSSLTFLPKSQALFHIGLSSKCRTLVSEGTIRSSKTISYIELFAMLVNESESYLHLISCKDSNAINDNILESNGLGLLKRYPNKCKLKKDSIGGFYISFIDTKYRKKKILLCGYDKAPSWSKILGKTLGVILVDEVNLAPKQFIDECFSRQASADNPKTLWTLNGDDPSHYIYQDYINYCEPITNSYMTIPQPILDEMAGHERKKGWYYIHWNFNDNPIMTPAKIEDIKNTYPVGSYYYTVKVLGIRGRVEGVIFKITNDNEYLEDENRIDLNRIIEYQIGLDLGNNENKRGTILTLTGFERGFTDVHVIEAYAAKSTEVNDLVDELTNKVCEWYDTYYFKRGMYGTTWIDSYGAIQLMMETLRKAFINARIAMKVEPCLKFGEEQGRRASLETIMMLIHQRRIHFTSKARETLNSLKRLVYNEKDGLPLDTNQSEMDFYDSLRYAIAPRIRELTRLMKGV